MIDLAPRELEAERTTVEVQFRGREYGVGTKTTPSPPRQGVHQLREAPQETQLSDQLAQALWNQLPWRTLPEDVNDRATIVRVYIESLAKLRELREEFEALVRATCVANLEFRQGVGPTHDGARRDVMNQRLEEMLKQSACDWHPIRNILDAPLVSQDPSRLRNKLDEELTEVIRGFSVQLFEMLAKLVDRELVGLVEWWSNHVCNYHFFKRVVIQQNEGTSTTVSESFPDAWPIYNPKTRRHIVGYRTTRDTRGKGRHIHTLARHEHKVLDAVRTSIENSSVVMPLSVVELIKNIPDWLRPFIEVVDGTLYRELIVVRETKVEDWLDEVVRVMPIEQRLESLIFGYEPAVCLGPFVLVGWGPREIDAELARRTSAEAVAEESRQIRSVRNRIPWMLPIGGGLVAFSYLVFDQALRGAGGYAVGVAAALATVFIIWQTIRDWQHTRGIVPTTQFTSLWTATFSFLLLVLGWCLVRWHYPAPIVIPLALLTGVAVCQHQASKLGRTIVKTSSLETEEERQ